MKRLLNILLFIAICPTLSALGIHSAESPTALENNLASSADVNYNPDRPFGYQTPTANDNSVGLNSSLFGMKGPLQIGTEYSENYGVILTGQYTQQIGQSNAFSLLLNGGTGQRRINLTWAHLLTQNQRIKVSIDHLSQRMKFDFDSGDIKKWDSQNAYGLTYQYVLNKGWLNDINLNAFYSQAGSENLSSKLYTQDGLTYENYRRIAGGTEKSISAGIDLLPTQTTGIGLQLSYDDLHYDMKYSHTDENQNGLGITASLHQLITKHLKLNLIASDRVAAKQFTAGIDYLIPTKDNTSVVVGLQAQRTLGGHGLPDDTSYAANVAFRWGQSSNDNSGFTLQRTSASSNLADWAATPAVEMSQVLAVSDQKSVLVTDTKKTQQSTQQTTQDVDTYTVYVNPKKPVDINVKQYLPNQKPSGTLLTAVATHHSSSELYKAENLPKTLDYNQPQEQIQGKLQASFATFDVELTPQNNAAKTSKAMPTIKLQVKNSLANGGSKPVAHQPSNQSVGIGWYMNRLYADKIYTNPPSSGKITYVKPTIKNKDGKIVNYSELRLGWKNDQLYSANKMPAAAASDSPYFITFRAINNKGSMNTSFRLYVEPGTAPQTAAIPAQDISAGNSIKPISVIHYFNSVAGGVDYSEPAIKNADSQSVSLSSLNLQWNNNTLSSTQGVPSNSYKGSPYTITFKASNHFGSSTDTMKLTVGTKPLAKPIASQTLQAGQEITPVNVTTFFNNPTGSGNINYATPEIQDKNQSAVSLSALNLSWNNNTLTSNAALPANMAAQSPFTITFKASNNSGSTTDTFQLNLTNPNSPSFSNLPNALTADQGHDYTTANPLINLASDINAGSGKIDSVTATLSNGSLSASGLSFTHNSDFSQMAITGTPNSTYAGTTQTLIITATNSFGKSASANIALNYHSLPVPIPGNSISANVNNLQNYNLTDLANHFSQSSSIENIKIDKVVNSQGSTMPNNIGLAITNNSGQFDLTGKIDLTSNNPAGAYTVEVSAKNDGGWSNPLAINLTIAKAPTFLSNPVAQVVEPGKAMTAVDMSKYFDANGGTLQFATNNISITGPNSSHPSLQDLGLSINGTQLQGMLPSTLTAGDYSIAFTATDQAGTSAKAAALQLTVTSTPAPGTAISTNIANGAAYSLTNLASHFTSSGSTINNFKVSSVSGPGLSSGNLSDLGLTLSGSTISGTINLGSHAAGTYTIDVNAENAAGWSTIPLAINLTIAKAPTFLSNPVAQVVEPGKAMTAVDMNKYFNANGGTLQFATNNISITGPNNSHPSLQDLGLSISGTQLQGTLPSTLTAGDYSIAFTATDQAGTSAKAAALQLTVTSTPAPRTAISTNVANGAAYSLTNLASHFTSSGSTINNFKVSSVSGPGLSSGNLSDLGLTLSGSTISGTINLGSHAAGTYTIDVNAENAAGWSTIPLAINLTIAKAPTFLSNPTAQTLSTGKTITAVDMSKYFNANGGTLQFATSNISVTGPNSSHPSLQDLGLSINGTNLEGTLPSNLTQGTYSIAFTATDQAGISADAATLTLTVVNAPIAVSAVSGSAANGTTYNLTNLASHFTSSTAITDIKIANVTDPNGKAISLATMGLTSSSANNGSISGTLNLGNEPAGTYTIEVDAENIGGWSTTPLTINLTTIKAPIFTNTNPAAISLLAGNTLPTLNMSNYFTEQNNQGSITFTANNIQVTGPNQQALSLSELGLAIDGDNLTGSLPTSLAGGTYTIAFKASNQAGAAANAATLKLTVSAYALPTPAAPISASLNNDYKYSLSDIRSDFSSPYNIDQVKVESITNPAGEPVSNLSDLGLSLSSDNITGRIILNNNPAGTYTINVIAHNICGWSTKPFTIQLTIAKQPVITTNKPIVQVFTNDKPMPIKPIDMSNYYTDQAGLGGPISYTTAPQIYGPYGKKYTFSQLNLKLEGTTISGTLPSGLEPGAYVFSFTAKNNVGQAASEAQVILNVNSFTK